MRERDVLVLGAGVAGLAAALMLARDGHRVTVLERDPFPVGDAEDSPGWPRRGIPHFLQPHAVIPRGRAELTAHLPDVHEALLDAGAWEVDLRKKLPGDLRPEDEELQYVAVRRPLIEWALRQAVLAEAQAVVHAGVDVTGLIVEGGRVRGAVVAGGTVDGDLVIDALGRRTPTRAWLAAAGAAGAAGEQSECGVIYYCRYYRQRPGFELPDGPFLLSPRGDLGYFGYASFPGDNGTFAALLAMPTGCPEWRAVKDADVFEAAVARIPPLHAWVDPDGVDPITDVMPMAGLNNTIRPVDTPHAMGLVPIGDARSHTDPVLAHGLSFALIHAAALTAALGEHGEISDALDAFEAMTTPELRERYDLATALDAQRLRMWHGGVPQVDRKRDYALFSMVAAGIVASVDPDVFRMFVRRIGLLDSTRVFDDDIEMQQRIEARFEELRAGGTRASLPTRDEMLATVRGEWPHD
jgi:2-polyprenyl-6-methoxyphenol hydroxylase-like FAD-dependent oxidoreductase